MAGIGKRRLLDALRPSGSLTWGGLVTGRFFSEAGVFRIGPGASSGFVAYVDLIIALIHMMVTQVVTIRKPSPGRLRECDLMIQITVFLEILISCFLRSVEVCFIQWANQPGGPRESRILRCGVVRGIRQAGRGVCRIPCPLV